METGCILLLIEFTEIIRKLILSPQQHEELQKV